MIQPEGVISSMEFGLRAYALCQYDLSNVASTEAFVWEQHIGSHALSSIPEPHKDFSGNSGGVRKNMQK